MKNQQIYALSSFEEKKSKPTIEETHTRQTYLIRNDLIERLNKLARRKDRGFKTHLINYAIEQALNEIDAIMAAQAGERKPLSQKIRFQVLDRDNFTCQYCGEKAPDVELEVDHINPVSKGGTDDLQNLVAACKSCNRGKGAELLGMAFEDDMQEIEQK